MIVINVSPRKMIPITQDVIDYVTEGFTIPSMPKILIEVQRYVRMKTVTLQT